MARILIILLLVVLAGVGIFFWLQRSGRLPSPAATPADLNVNLTEMKPAAWTPYDGLERVNIDGDEEQEYLLFYRFDGGELGGVIYDPQNAPLGIPSIPIPDQSPSSLVPYRLLPDYGAFKPAGYLGTDDLDWKPVYISPPANTDGEPPPHDRLIVLGKERQRINRVSIFWWIDAQRGYGAAHANTPGWFSLSQDKPYDWIAWDTGAPYITRLWAWEPQMDRSNLCRRASWELTEGSDPDLTREFVADYSSNDIYFCSGDIPAEPAYPEAQLLAYLFDQKNTRWAIVPGGPDIPVYRDVVVHGVSRPAMPPVEPGGTIIVAGWVNFSARQENDQVFDSAQERRLNWQAIMLKPETITETVRWRIISLQAP